MIIILSIALILISLLHISLVIKYNKLHSIIGLVSQKGLELIMENEQLKSRNKTLAEVGETLRQQLVKIVDKPGETQ